MAKLCRIFCPLSELARALNSGIFSSILSPRSHILWRMKILFQQRCYLLHDICSLLFCLYWHADIVSYFQGISEWVIFTLPINAFVQRKQIAAIVEHRCLLFTDKKWGTPWFTLNCYINLSDRWWSGSGSLFVALLIYWFVNYFHSEVHSKDHLKRGIIGVKRSMFDVGKSTVNSYFKRLVFFIWYKCQ